VVATEKPCQVCGRAFLPYRPNDKYCSHDCRLFAWTRRNSRQVGSNASLTKVVTRKKENPLEPPKQYRAVGTRSLTIMRWGTQSLVVK